MVLNTRTRSPGDRILSFFLAVVFALSCVAVAVPVFRLKAKATDPGKQSGTINFEAGTLNYDSTLVEAGSGSYRLTLNISSDVKAADQNTNSKVATDGYFVADFTGLYLVELWGGNGANGSDDFGDGGKGGSGGHVYGYVYLNKGDVLYYDLGGAGIQSNAPNSDAAANGGAAHGEQGNKKVGGGGGYSAVYLFKNGNTPGEHDSAYFENTYLDENGKLNLSDVSKANWEYDRTHNYIMVAGGAGGGGAGRGAGGAVRNFISGSDPTPDGGNGGNANGTAKELSNGYVFAGADGKSSTKKDQGHIGKGGSDVPGETYTTALGWWEGGDPNNWDGTAVSGVPGGYGAKGNFRGGGGGAGYCGGSGGIQKSALIPEDVGGGGGGSSFIAKTVNDQEVEYSSVPDDIKNRTNPNDATTGGGFVDINYMGDAGDVAANTNWLSDLTFVLNTTPYFNVTAKATKNSTEFSANVVDHGNTGSQVSLSGMDFSDGDTYTITIDFTPKPEFKGGNKVDLFVDFDEDTDNFETIALYDKGFDPYDINTYDHLTYVSLSDDVSYVNVPLNLTAEGKTVELPADGKFNTADLYNDIYKRNTDGSNPYIANSADSKEMFSYIGTLSKYYVKSSEGDTIKASADEDKSITIDPPKATVYTVGFTVTPKYSAAEAAKVGKPVADTNEITAMGYADTAEKVTLNGITYNTTKEISYSEESDTYTLKLKLSSNANNELLDFTQNIPADAESKTKTIDKTTDKIYVTPADGWYLVQVLGGSGGKGGDVSIARDAGITGLLDDKEEASGGAGGSGAYVNEWYYLEKGTTLEVTQIGENGEAGADDSKTTSNNGYVHGTGGEPGSPTTVEITEPGKTDGVEFIVAGAGGGGGGAAATTGASTLITHRRSNAPGTDGQNSTTSSTLNAAEYGGNGNTNRSGNTWTSTGGAGGKASRTFITARKADTPALTATAQSVYDTYTSSSLSLYEPSVRIVLLDEDISPWDEIRELYKNKLSGIAVTNYEFTEYFTDITLTPPSQADFDAAFSFDAMAFPNGDGTETKSAHLTDLTWTFSFKTIDGFFGGNNIEALKSITLKQSDDTQADGFKRFAGTTHETLNDVMVMPQDYPGAKDTDQVLPNSKTDYVNYKLADPMKVSVNNKIFKVAYGTTVALSDLFTVEKDEWTDAGVKAAYVDRIYEKDFPDGGYTATENKTFTFKYGIAPTSPTSKGTVDTLTKEKYESLNASVEVYNIVSTDLTHMEYSGPDTVDLGDNLTATLKVESGYINPELVSITSGGVELNEGTDYSYDSEYGELVIYADSMKGEVVITAKADPQKYHVYFIAYDENSQVMNELTNVRDNTYPNNNGVYNGTYTDVYVYADSDITGCAPTITPELRDQKTGYQFKWDWGTDDGQPLTKMPASNVWVYGTFYPYTYTLTINYVDENGNPVADPYVNNKIPYGSSGSIESPVVSGKQLKDPSQGAYNFTIDEAFLAANNVSITGGDITVDIKYVPKDHVLTLRYIAEDTDAFLGSNTYVKFADSGTSYDLIEANLLKPAGYKIANIQYYDLGAENKGEYLTLPQTISGITQDSDIIVDIYYEHEFYTVTFNANGHGTAPDPIEHVGYDSKITKPDDPTEIGYTFDTWYKDASFEDDWDFDTDTVTKNTDLYAKWNPIEYTVTFVYADGVTESTEGKVKFDTAYGTLPAPTRTGYKFDGWYTGLTDGDKVEATTVYHSDAPDDHELYAHWTPLDFWIRFEKDNGTAMEEYQATFATTFSIPNQLRNVTKNGYTFIGWKSGSELYSDLPANATEIGVNAGDVTYTAQWEENRNIVVTVIDKHGDPVTNATLVLKDANNAAVMTNEAGEYTFSRPANGTYTVEATVAARADIGNRIATAAVTKVDNSKNVEVTVKFENYDVTKPIVAHDYDGKWKNADVVVNLSDFTQDPEVYGTSVYQYKVGEGEWKDVPTAGQYTATASETVYFRAISESGIVGDSTDPVEIKIDKVKPTISAELLDSATITQSKTIKVTELSDDNSGIATLELGVYNDATDSYQFSSVDKTLAEHVVDANGKYILRATDNAGNIQDTSPIVIENIDNTNPELKITAKVGDNAYSGEWTNKNVVITVEDISGSRGTTTFKYSTDNGAHWETAGLTTVGEKTATLTVSDECATREYKFMATSQSGKVVTPDQKVTLNIDKTAPTGTATLEGNTWSKLVDAVDLLDLFYKDPKTGSITADDTGIAVSGVAKIYYIVTSEPKTEAQLDAINVWEKDATQNKQFIIDDPQGDKILYVLITDNAGNRTYISSASKNHIQYDHEPPVINAIPNFNEDSWTTTSEATITVSSITDNVTGLKKDTVNISYSTDGTYYDRNGNPASKPADFNAVDKEDIAIADDGSFLLGDDYIPNGDYTITITASDKAGNEGTKVIHVKRTTEECFVVSNPTDTTVTYGAANASMSFTAKSVSGIVSYEWQKCESTADPAFEENWVKVAGEEFTGDLPKNVSNTYVIDKPTVVAYDNGVLTNNNGDRFRVIVVSNSTPENVTRISPAATLTVNKRELTITPKPQSYRYGTDESIETEFDAATIDENSAYKNGVYWTFFNDLPASRPIAEDIGKVSFAGQFKRSPGIVPDTYVISSDVEPKNVRLANDATGNNVNGNYYLRIEPTSSSFTITEYDPGVEATLKGSQKDTWFNGLLYKDTPEAIPRYDGVHIVAPEGYKISWTNNVTDDGWDDYLTVPDGEYKDGKTYYLRNVSDSESEYYRAITVAKTTIPFGQDKIKPTGTIVIDSTTWDDILDKLHIKFEIFRSKNVEATITSNDDRSGVDTVKYYVAHGEAVTDITTIAANQWIKGDSVKIDKADKDKIVVYARIEDKAGNVNYYSSNGYMFDLTPPAISAEIVEPDKIAGSKTIKVNSITEDASNIVEVVINGETKNIADITFPYSFTVSENGTYVIKAKNDAIGASGEGLETVVELKVTTVDKNIPGLAVSATAGDAIYTGGWTQDDVTITVTDDSNTLGKTTISYVYSDDNGTSWITPDPSVIASDLPKQASIVVTEDCKGRIYKFTGVSEAGVESEPVTFTVNRDSTPPAITIAPDGFEDGKWSNKTSLSAQVTLSDTYSGINASSVTYTYSNSDKVVTPSITDGKFTISNDDIPNGEYTITITVKDNAGNQTTETINIKRADASSLTVTGLEDPAAVTYGDAKITLTVSAESVSGIKSYEWQKRESGSDVWETVATYNTADTTSTYDITDPTVTGDNGDIYRVIVTSTSEVSKPSDDEATIRVNPKQIQAVPSAKSYYYGTPASMEYQFTADAANWSFAEGYEPLEKDKAVLSYEGGFVRTLGNDVGKYDIVSDGFKIADGVTVKNNYDLSVTGGEDKFVIKAFDPRDGQNRPIAATLEGDTHNDWYYLESDGDGARIVAPTGYSISKSNDPNGEWASFITVPDDNYTEGYTYYLRYTDVNDKDSAEYLAITAAKQTAAFKQDTAAPKGEVRIGDNFWDRVLKTITFGIFKPDTATATISYRDDNGSIHQAAKYFISDKALTEADVRAHTDWTTLEGNSVNIPNQGEPNNKDKFVVYVMLEDEAGNTTYIASDGHVFDTEPPAITVTTVNFNANEWTTATDLAINVKAADGEGESGLDADSVSYTYVGNDLGTVKATVNESGEFTIADKNIPTGEYDIIITASDAVGNTNTKTIHVMRDTDAALSITQNPADVSVEYGTDSVIFTVNAKSDVSAITSYQWQKLEKGSTKWENYGDEILTDETTNTLTVTKPSVVKDNGDKYRVIVKNAAGSVVTSTEVTLTVTPIALTVKPLDKAYDYGTEASRVTEFPASDNTNWTFTGENAPINNDAVTLTGKFVREAGNGDPNQTKTYDITADGVALANDTEGANVNGNYTLTVESTPATFTINVYVAGAAATLDGSQNAAETWYNGNKYADGVHIVAPEGYVISADGAVNGEWAEYLTVKDGEYDGVKYYLKNTATAAITSEMVTAAFKQDTVAPTGSIKIDDSTWKAVVEDVDFATYKAADISATVTTADERSGKGDVWYYISETALTEDAVLALPAGDLKAAGDTVTMLSEGMHGKTNVLYIIAEDVAGNRYVLSSDGFTFDTTPPTVEAAIENASSITATKLMTISNVTEDVSGIAKLEVGKYNPATGAYDFVAIAKDSTAYNVNSNGKYVVRVTNGAGVSVTTPEMEVTTIDNEDPVLTVSAKAGGVTYDGTWTKEDVVITVKDTSDTLGKTTFWYSTDNGTNWTEISSSDDKQAVLTLSTDCKGVEYTFKGVSAGGKTSNAPASVTVNIDKTAPTGEATLGENGWTKFVDTVDVFNFFFNSPQNGVITASDNENGSGLAKIYYIVDSAKMTEADLDGITVWNDVTDNPSFIIEAPDGDKVLYVLLKDNVGNKTYISSQNSSIVYDTIAPVITAEPSFNLDEWTTDKNVSIDVTVSDERSGFKQDTAAISYSTDGTYYDNSGNPASKPADFDVKDKEFITVTDGSFRIDNTAENLIPNGDYRITITATDNAGNPASKTLHIMKADDHCMTVDFPSDQTVVYGSDAAFKASVDSVVPITSFTWQKSTNGTDWTDVKTLDVAAGTKVINDTLTVTKPSVVRDDGSLYRVVITTQASELASTSTPAELTVQQRELVVKPVINPYEFYFGTEGSRTTEFLVDEGENYEIVSGLFGTDDITLVGKFVREAGNNPGTYIISSGDVRFADDGEGNNVNGNYKLIIAAADTKFVIKAFDEDNLIKAELDGSQNSEETWFNGNKYAEGVHIKAPAGYSISRSNAYDGTWAEYLNIDNGEYADGIVYFLREDATGAITVEKTTAAFNEDTVAPTGKIWVDDSKWDKFLETITFGLYKSKDVEVSIDYDDVGSGVKTVSYCKVTTAMTLDQIKAYTDWTTGDSFDIAKADKDKFIIYAKIEDVAGNITYLSSQGYVFDLAAPVITATLKGFEDGVWTNAEDISIDVSIVDGANESGLDADTVSYKFSNGGTFDVNAASFSIANGDLVNGEYTITITASDNVGNTATKVITVKRATDSAINITEDKTGFDVTYGDAAATFTVTADSLSGIKSYQWQKYNDATGEWDNLDTNSIGVVITTADDKSTSTLTVQNPTVIADDGDTYKVIVTSNAGDTATASAVLSVAPKQLVITPNTQSYNFGTEDSTKTSFSISETSLWSYADGKAPINGDAVELEGRYVRSTGTEAGKYDLIPDGVALKAGVAVNDNYTLTAEIGEDAFIINVFNPDEDASLVGTAPNGWYIMESDGDGVRITAPAGYTISTDRDAEGDWAPYLTVADGTYTGVDYFLKDTSTGSITSKKTTEAFKQDTVAPTGEVKLDGDKWTAFVNPADADFDTFKGVDLTVNVTPADERSGVDKVYYYESATAMSKADVLALDGGDWTETGTDYTAPVTAVQGKQAIIYIKVTDVAGNITLLSTNGFKFDTTAPTLTATVVEPDTVAQTKTISISDVADPESGVTKLEIGILNPDSGEYKWVEKSIDTTAYTVAENGTYAVRVTNGAGLVKEVKNIVIDKVDTTQPVLIVTALSEGQSYNGNWTNKNVEITVKDDSTALGKTDFYYSTDGGNTWSADPIPSSQDKQATLVLSDDCNTEYMFKAETDAGLHVESGTATPVKIDTTLPTGTVEILEYSKWAAVVNVLDPFNIFFNTPQEVEINAADTASGIKEILYTIVEDPVAVDAQGVPEITSWDHTITNGGSFMISNPDGDKIVYVRIEDNAGNRYYISTDGFVLDQVKPEITTTPSFNADTWTTDPNVSIDVVVSDATSGLDKTNVKLSYSADGNYNGAAVPAETTVPAGDFTSDSTFTVKDGFIPNGDYVLTITVKDKAGNENFVSVHVMREGNDCLVITDPVSTTVTYGENATFTVTGKSISGISSFEWYKYEKGSTTRVDASTIDGITITESTAADGTVTSVLTVTKPEVVADTGDRYEVVVNCVSTASKTTVPATLTVIPKEITIAPLAQNPYFGSEASTVTEFPVTAATQGTYWDYATGKNPLAGDTVVLQGKFVRNAGNAEGEYTIKVADDPDDVKLNPDIAVNSNYTLIITPSIATFTIRPYNPIDAAALVGEKVNGWYIRGDDGDGVRITPPSGFSISTFNSPDDDNWKDFLTVEDSDYTNGITYYLRNENTGSSDYLAITEEMKTIPFKQDTTAPEGTITIDEASWKVLLQKVTFGIYKNNDLTLSITATDENSSGVSSIKYYISDTALSESDVYALTQWKDWQTNPTNTISKDQYEQVVVYALIEDNAGNKAYVSSDGHVFDTDAPVVTVNGTEVADGTTESTSGTRNVVAKDDAIDKIVVVELDENGQPKPGTEVVYTDEDGDGVIEAFISNDADKTYQVTAVDKAGNDTVYTVEMTSIPTFIDELDDNWTDPDKPTKDEILDAIAAIDDILNNEGDNLDDTADGQKEKELLEQKKEELQNMLNEDDQAIKDAKDKAKSDLEKAAEEAIKAIKDGEEYENLPKEIQDLIDEINTILEQAEKAIDDLTGTYPGILEDIKAIVDPAKEQFTDNVAEDFVYDHASPSDFTNPYDKENDPADVDNAQQIIDGEDEYDGYDETIQKKIDDLIKQKSETSDDPYSGYPEMLEAAKQALEDAQAIQDAKDKAKSDLEKAAEEAIKAIKDGEEYENLPKEIQDLIDEINTILEQAEKAIDDLTGTYPGILEDIKAIVDPAKEQFTDNVAEDFVYDHASPSDYTNPYDKDNDPADADNAQQIIDGEDEYDGYSDEIKAKIDALIDNDTDPTDNPYSGYPEMLQAAKDALAEKQAKDDAKKEIDDAADAAIAAVKDGKQDDELTPEEQALIDDINDKRDEAKKAIDDLTGTYPDILDDIKDIVDEAKDTFDDKVAEDFVNDYCSDNDASNPYDKANDPVDEDNAQQVVSGEDEWNGLSDKVKQKIDDLIKAKSEDSDEPYSGYEDMIYTAQKILNPDELTVPEVQEIMVKDGYIHVDIQVENLIDPDNKNADNIDEIVRILSKSVDQSDADVFNAGGHVEIVMIIREIKSDPANEAAIKADGNTLVKHIEVIIQKTQIAADGSVIADKSITKTAEPITFVVPLGDAEKQGRVFYVYVDHGGRAPAEKNPDGDGVLVTATVAFTNDTFSVFSIAYTAEPEQVAYTGDPTPIFATLMMMFSSLGGTVIVGKKRREEENEMY